MLAHIFGRAVSHKNTLRSIAWNYIGYLYNITITFGLTSYVVRRIPVAEYGLFLFVLSLSGTLYLLDMGISSVLVQAYVKAAESSGRDHFNNLMGTVFLALSALGGIGVLGFSGIALALPGPFKIPHQYLHEASIIFLIAALVIQVGLPSIALEQAYQAFHRFDRLNQIQLVISTVQMVLYVVVLAAGNGIVALALVLLAMSVLRLALLIIALPSSVPGARLSISRFGWMSLQPLIQLSKWAFLNNINTYMFDLFVWMILGSFGSMREAAIFGLASKAPKQIWNLVDKGTNVVLPILSRSSARNNLGTLQRTYIRTQKLVFGAVLPFVVLGCFFARPLIEVWAGAQYAEAAIVMQWLLIAAFSHAMSYPSDQLLYASGEVKQATKISFWSGSMSIVGALLLVSRFGAAGLAAGMALAQLLINCTWYTVAACKLSQTSPIMLLLELAHGMAWPLGALVAEIVLVQSISSHLSSISMLVAALASGVLYLGLWGYWTARPIYREQMEIVA